MNIRVSSVLAFFLLMIFGIQAASAQANSTSGTSASEGRRLATVPNDSLAGSDPITFTYELEAYP